MKAKVGLTLACVNIKKWVKMLAGKPFYFSLKSVLIKIQTHFKDSSTEDIKKTNTKMMFVFDLLFIFLINSLELKNNFIFLLLSLQYLF